MVIPVSVVVLTENEEQNLPECLSSLSWCDDIHVVDSGSNDRTVALAQEADVHCYCHPFESFGTQRNWALDNCTLQHEWVLFLDADERSTPAFCEALATAVSRASDETAGFYCCWKTILEERWLRRCDSYPKWQFRLARVGRACFEDFGHGQREGTVDGRLEYLREPYLHYPFNKGWSYWLSRHNLYSTQEALLRADREFRFKELLSRHPSIRKKSLRTIASSIPGWPLMRFMIMYIFRLGFLDGIPGLIYCVNMSYYEFLIRIKMREIRKGNKSL